MINRNRKYPKFTRNRKQKEWETENTILLLIFHIETTKNNKILDK